VRSEDERKELKKMFDGIQMKHFQIRSDLASYAPFGPCTSPGHLDAVDAIRGMPDTEISRPKVVDKDNMYLLPDYDEITEIPGVQWDLIPKYGSTASETFTELITNARE